MTAQEAGIKLYQVPSNMPVFVLLGSDPCAPEAVLAWAGEALKQGVNVEKIDGALNALKTMIEWVPKKLPD